MTTKTYNVLGTDGWTRGEIREWYAHTQQPGWLKLQEYLKRDKIQMGSMVLDPKCSPEEHRAFQGRASLIDDILILDVMLKDIITEMDAEEKGLDKPERKG